jgi:hypothetical protein
LNADKEGYAGAAFSGFRALYVLKRAVHAADVHAVAQLSGANLNEDRFRSALRSLIEDPEAGESARSLLAFIGVPEDVHLIAQLPAPKGQQSYAVTCALLQPAAEAEWSLLRAGALDEYHDYRLVRGAIQSLQLIASPRSRQIQRIDGTWVLRGARESTQSLVLTSNSGKTK